MSKEAKGCGWGVQIVRRTYIKWHLFYSLFQYCTEYVRLDLDVYNLSAAVYFWDQRRLKENLDRRKRKVRAIEER